MSLTRSPSRTKSPVSEEKIEKLFNEIKDKTAMIDKINEDIEKDDDEIEKMSTPEFRKNSDKYTTRKTEQQKARKKHVDELREDLHSLKELKSKFRDSGSDSAERYVRLEKRIDPSHTVDRLLTANTYTHTSSRRSRASRRSRTSRRSRASRRGRASRRSRR